MAFNAARDTGSSSGKPAIFGRFDDAYHQKPMICVIKLGLTIIPKWLYLP
jgi:hypothetical protein